jgi:hypothetical protein
LLTDAPLVDVLTMLFDLDRDPDPEAVSSWKRASIPLLIVALNVLIN